MGGASLVRQVFASVPRVDLILSLVLTAICLFSFPPTQMVKREEGRKKSGESFMIEFIGKFPIQWEKEKK